MGATLQVDSDDGCSDYAAVYRQGCAAVSCVHRSAAVELVHVQAASCVLSPACLAGRRCTCGARRERDRASADSVQRTAYRDGQMPQLTDQAQQQASKLAAVLRHLQARALSGKPARAAQKPAGELEQRAQDGRVMG